MHTLVVEAVDSAGNKSDAKARFTIDHTPPVIRFENIREGESYEKERKFISERKIRKIRLNTLRLMERSKRVKSKRDFMNVK